MMRWEIFLVSVLQMLVAGSVVDKAEDVRIMALGDSITGSPVRDRPYSNLAPVYAYLNTTGLLAGASVAKVAAKWHQEHKVCGNAASTGVWIYLRRSQRRTRRDTCNRNRIWQAVASVAIPNAPRHCDGPPGY